jgi:hypothetical protein
MAALQFVAVMCSALFAGAALYISIVEHPARISAGIAVALQEFRPSYRRAAVFQISMAVVACVSSFALSLFTSEWSWFRYFSDSRIRCTEITRPMGKASPDPYHCWNARSRNIVRVFSADTLIRFQISYA